MAGDAPAPRAKALIPKDAATLLILDRSPSGVHVLMGRRRDDLAFNPGAYVFPGGRVDRQDGLAPAAAEMSAAMQARLLDRMRAKPSRRRARALMIAALRETAEETGYLVGRKGAGHPAADGPFGAFREKDVGLDLSMPRLIGRAITPVKRPRRFDARFFAVWAEDAIAHHPTDAVPPDNELSDVRFVPLTARGDLKLPRMTVIMLDELVARLADDPDLSRDLPAPFYVPVGENHRRETI